MTTKEMKIKYDKVKDAADEISRAFWRLENVLESTDNESPELKVAATELLSAENNIRFYIKNLKSEILKSLRPPEPEQV